LHDLSSSLETRQDTGLLVQSAVFQEILKFKTQNFFDFKIHFWRTQSGAEVDFGLYLKVIFVWQPAHWDICQCVC